MAMVIRGCTRSVGSWEGPVAARRWAAATRPADGWSAARSGYSHGCRAKA